MIESPLVSVIIPTYNCEQYIEQTLSSVFAQTHRGIEVIVVDDGSTDRTVQLAEAYSPAVRVVRQTNQRVCRARNKGFSLSTGEFVCFLDHDDYWFPWKIELQLDAFQLRPEAGVVFTDFLNWHPAGTEFPDPIQLGNVLKPELVVNEEYSGWIYHHFLITCWALTSATMIRREVFLESGGFNAKLPYAEDWDLWLRLSRTHQFIRLNAKATLYRQHASQGNRLLRKIDYRTSLLTEARTKWGLASPDGRAVTSSAFRARLARYYCEFAINQLRHNKSETANHSFWLAWKTNPKSMKYLAMFLAAKMGWRPHPP